MRVSLARMSSGKASISASTVSFRVSIEEKGLERMGELHVKHVEGRLWEIRLKGRSGISRALYYGCRLSSIGGAGLREEDGENAGTRDRSGSVTREVGSMRGV
jgi:hypothetical protein